MNKKISTPWGMVIILIIALAAIGGLILAFQGWHKLSSWQIIAPTSSDSTVKWKVYKNEDFGFEFKYPNDWYFKEIKEPSPLVNLNLYDNGKVNVTVVSYLYSKGFDLGDWAGKNSLNNPDFFKYLNTDYLNQKKEEDFINGIKIVKITTVFNDFPSDYNKSKTEFETGGWLLRITTKEIFFPCKDMVCSIHMKFFNENTDYGNSMFNEILSTFKFIRKDKAAQNPTNTPSPTPEGKNLASISYFYDPKYQNYEGVDQYIEANDIAKKINITKYDISNKENEKLWRKKIEDDCKKMAGVPSIWDGKNCYVGSNDIINYLSQLSSQPIVTSDPSIKPQIIVTSPKEGDAWTPGFSYGIAWDSQGILSDADISIKLSYMRVGESSPRESLIFSGGTTSVKNTGFYMWFINTDNFTVYGPSYNNQSNKYRIRVIYYDPKTYEIKANDYSDYFSIVPTSVVVVSPNGGETWRVGETHNIIWETQNIPESSEVQISLYDNNSSILVTDTTNSGSYSWTIPSKMWDRYPITGINNMIAIFVTDSGTKKTYSDESNLYFTIVAE